MATIASCAVGSVGLASAIGMDQSPCHDSLRHCLEHVGNQGEGAVTDGKVTCHGKEAVLLIEDHLLASQQRCCDAYIDSRYAMEDPYCLDRLSLPGGASAVRDRERDYGHAVQRSTLPRQKDGVPLLKATYFFVRLKSHGLKPSSDSPQWAIVLQKARA
jgi:hypothetical protein